jgi:tRNA-modifying protein YgfZ
MSGLIATSETMSLFISHLSDRTLLSVTGADAVDWLEGLVTQSLGGMAPGGLRHTALLSPQGRLLADFIVRRTADGLLLDVDAGGAEALLSRLSMYRLRAQVTLARGEGTVHAIWGDTGAVSGPHSHDPRLAALGLRLVGEDPPQGENASLEAYVRHRRSLGVAEVAADGLADRVYATEANLDLLGSIDFHKGCYVGQETTSRMKRRNGVRSRILPLSGGQDLKPGDEVLNGELRAGEVLAADGGAGLALLRLDRIAGACQAAGHGVAIMPPEWMPSDVLSVNAQQPGQ